ncbi:hydroxyethylthiazole kinase [Aestuariimicrobium kwangyangense]|uniref:hydroxyethylthiazole kinase n=1 Tax=Aestuariimicrobium kwangyangense TaxID=396389 RepID=UPI0003B339C3|nr:hydroxyethylthiazole kinase [Aestuariimicrobium kwangyangense]
MTEFADVVDRVRDQSPLVHCITGSASINYVANALLAAGARPMMTDTGDDAPHAVRSAAALLVNLGTLSSDAATAILPTLEAAHALALPWVLDPVGIGSLPTRTALARQLASLRPTAIRCNPSEALVLAGDGQGGSGPDNTAPFEDAVRAARPLASRLGAVLAISGPGDLVTDGCRSQQISSGHALLQRVTGTGCALGALVAACCAVADPFLATVTAHAWLGSAAELAAAEASGPGDFAWRLLNALDSVLPEAVAATASRR